MASSTFVREEEGRKVFPKHTGDPHLPKTLAATARAAGRDPRAQQQHRQINSRGKGKDRRTRGILVKKLVSDQRRQFLLGGFPACALEPVADSEVSAKPAAASLRQPAALPQPARTHGRPCSLPASSPPRPPDLTPRTCQPVCNPLLTCLGKQGQDTEQALS